MSNELIPSSNQNPIDNPGLPAHVHRQTDEDPKAEKRAERQVASLFLLSALSTVLFIYSYIWIPDDIFTFIPILGEMNLHQLLLGIGMSGAFLFIGIGALAWSRTDEDVVRLFRAPWRCVRSRTRGPSQRPQPHVPSY